MSFLNRFKTESLHMLIVFGIVSYILFCFMVYYLYIIPCTLIDSTFYVLFGKRTRYTRMNICYNLVHDHKIHVENYLNSQKF